MRKNKRNLATERLLEGYGIQSQKAETTPKDTSYSILYNEEGKPETVVIDTDIFEGQSGKSQNSTVRKYLVEYVRHNQEIIPTLMESGQKVYLGKDLPNEYVYSKSAENNTGDIRQAKMQAAQNSGELIEIATNRRWESYKHESHKENAKYGFYRYETQFRVQDQSYTADLLIRNAADGKKYLYDILNIKKVTAIHRGFKADTARPKAARSCQTRIAVTRVI